MENQIVANFFEKIRSSVRVSEQAKQKFRLDKKGNEYLTTCPFHSEKTPSFTINDQKKFYHCFGCGAHGDVIKLISEIEGISYKDSAYKIARENNIPLPNFSDKEKKEQELSEKIISILREACNFFKSKLDKKTIDYLTQRNIDIEKIKTYEIGYTGGKGDLIDYFKKKSININDLLTAGIAGKSTKEGNIYEFFKNRVIIPIKNNFGEIIAFGGRVFENELPKYINSPETIIFKKGESLYGLDIATSSAYQKNRIIVVEGYFDVIALQTNGFKETVASLGTSITQKQIEKLWKICDEIILCLDGDDAGFRASKKLIDNALPLIQSNKKLSFITLDDKKDPDNIIYEFGRNYFENLIEKRIALSDFIWNISIKSINSNNAESRSELENILFSYCEMIDDKIYKKNLRRYFSDLVWRFFNFNSTKQTSKNNVSKNSINDDIINFTDIELIILDIISLMIFNTDKINTENINKFINHDCFFEFLDESDENKVYDHNKIHKKVNNNLENFIKFIISNISKSSNDDFNLLEFLSTGEFTKIFNFINKRYLLSYKQLIDKFSVDEVIDFMFKKIYLFNLKIEYKKILSDDFLCNERFEFYTNEIKKTQHEVSILTEKYITNR